MENILFNVIVIPGRKICSYDYLIKIDNGTFLIDILILEGIVVKQTINI